jgi:glutathione synthase/RimK-type ligase-like ATP-grasp enzyme
MNVLLVVDNPQTWPLELSGVQVMSSKEYLNTRTWSQKRLHVFNLCYSYKYQSKGYYVSLLAAARGHIPVPSLSSILDMRSMAVIKMVSQELQDKILKRLSDRPGDSFELTIYFGKTVSKTYEKLGLALFNMFQAPFLKAVFHKKDNWSLSSIVPIPASEIPDQDKNYVETFAKAYFERPGLRLNKPKQPRYEIAVLVDPEQDCPPSNEKALQKFLHIADEMDMDLTFITKDDYSRLSEFDALFIRETTGVNHHTFRFAQRAEASGLVVLDDPQSILKCANKVYLAELLQQHTIPCPKSLIVHKDNISEIESVLGFPCVLKQPDGSFSKGVLKVHSKEELQKKVMQLLDESELIVAQEFLPTEFDWRIGVLDGKPLFACKYFMADNHWQILNWTKKGMGRYGKFETLALEDVPATVLDTAVRVSRWFGNGLYGVDIKYANNKAYVIEVNDNPNIDNGIEDLVEKDEIYKKIIGYFLRKLDA